MQKRVLLTVCLTLGLVVFCNPVLSDITSRKIMDQDYAVSEPYPEAQHEDSSIITTGDWSFGQCHGVSLDGDYAYIADGYNFHVLNISYPSTPKIVSGVFHGHQVTAMQVQGNYAYITCHSGGLIIINITAPQSPVQIGHNNLVQQGGNVYMEGNYAYIANGQAGMAIIQITNPNWRA